MKQFVTAEVLGKGVLGKNANVLLNINKANVVQSRRRRFSQEGCDIIIMTVTLNKTRLLLVGQLELVPFEFLWS